MRAFIDPETGKLVSQRPEGVQRLETDFELSEALRTDSEGIVPRAIPGKGVEAHLQGRFRSVVFATVKPDGTIEVKHAPRGVDPLSYGERHEHAESPEPASEGDQQ